MNARLCFLGCMLAIGLTGCIEVEVPKEVEAAIKALESFTATADRTPEKLQQAANNVIDHLNKSGATFLAKDGQLFVQKTLGRAGVVPKAALVAMDRRVQGHFEALKTALQEALPKVKAAGSKEKMIELLRNLRVEPPRLDPYVDSAALMAIEFDLHRSHDGIVQSVKRTSPQLLEVYGDALIGVPQEELRFAISNELNEQRELTLPGCWVEHTDFVGALDLSVLDAGAIEAIQGMQGRLRFQVLHKDRLLVGFVISVLETAEAPPAVPEVKVLTRRLHAVGDGAEGRAKETILIEDGWELVEIRTEEWTKNFHVPRAQAQSENLWTYNVEASGDRRSVVAECWANSRPLFGARRWIGIDVQVVVQKKL